jgi:hypothetical protein
MEERPLLPHLVPEFLTWLWYASERDRGTANLGEEIGSIAYWVDDRIAFRDVESDKPRAVLTGENPASAPEARAALSGGKVLRELRLVLRRDDREFTCTLRGPHLDLQSVKLPQMIKGAAEEVLYDRMALYEELYFMIAGLMQRFAVERASEVWVEQTLPGMRAWISGGSATPPEVDTDEDAP